MLDELIGLTKVSDFTLRKWILNDLRVIQSLPDSLKNINLIDDGWDMKKLEVQ
jgi:hypothetical protein